LLLPKRFTFSGAPKGVLRDNGGHLVAMSYSMKHVFGMNEGEVWWAASDIGWVVGHSYIVYGNSHTHTLSLHLVRSLAMSPLSELTSTSSTIGVRTDDSII
jgi:hypothetical protein